MPGTIIIGAQFGDEGKGKVTDFYAHDADLVVRYQGGNNAGHTLVAGGKTIKLHVLPSGILRGSNVAIGAGVVLNPEVLITELQDMGNQMKGALMIDPRVNIIMPWHTAQDGAMEGNGNPAALGTTLRGIGPCYADRALRVSAIRFEDLVNEARLKEKIHAIYPHKKKLMEAVLHAPLPEEAEIVQAYHSWGEQLKPHLKDVSLEVGQELDQGRKVLFEGAQGTFLDNDFGTFPYVTSSHPISGGATTGIGMPGTRINHVVGVIKAYTTRVGEGPMPTELKGEEAEKLRNKGEEFGTTTGRARRVGWLDLPLLRSAARLNGFTELAITKLDVLCGMGTLKVATTYREGTEEWEAAPWDWSHRTGMEPIYREMGGFDFSPEEVGKIADLPGAALEYLSLIEQAVHAPITLVSIGPGREQTLTQ